MSETVLEWETEIYQDSEKPIFRTMYGKTLLEAVQRRWQSQVEEDPHMFFVPGLLGASPTVTVASGTAGGVYELVIANNVDEVEVKNIKPNFVVLTELN